MPDNNDRNVVPSSGGVFNDLAVRIKLILRLMGDPRVNPIIKMLPIGAVLYLIFPDIAPGPIDDVAVIWLGSFLFVELCPPEVVQEHMDALTQVVPGEWSDAPEVDEQVVDAEYWEKEE
jgi:hypothetical protein